jgi:hypothetical protein
MPDELTEVDAAEVLPKLYWPEGQVRPLQQLL